MDSVSTDARLLQTQTCIPVPFPALRTYAGYSVLTEIKTMAVVLV